jgi:arabinose-5-phosphate isomerase
MLNKGVFVRDVMLKDEDVPIVKHGSMFRVALEKLNDKKMGIICITAPGSHLVGVMTDGDVRRIVLNSEDPLPMLFVQPIEDFMSTSPVTVSESMGVKSALQLLNQKLIWAAPVIDKRRKVMGLFHMQFALRSMLEF